MMMLRKTESTTVTEIAEVDSRIKPPYFFRNPERDEADVPCPQLRGEIAINENG